MKMANIQEVYDNINILLQDICKFLSEEKLRGLSLSERRHADALILRSKEQLQQIAAIIPHTNAINMDSEYVDMMQRNPEITTQNSQESQENQNVIYQIGENSSKDLLNSSIRRPTRVEFDPTFSPYKDLPAQNASKSIKCGYILMKRKVIFNIKTKRNVYASIHNNWLLIYSQDRDLKPKHAFDLREHKAKESSSEMFELTSSLLETYDFAAETYKDMLQWVTHINNCQKYSTNSQDIVEQSEDNDFKEYYDSIGNDKAEDDEENIYVEIIRNESKTLQPLIEPQTQERPPLPGRRPSASLLQKKTTPIRKYVLPPVITLSERSEKYPVANHTVQNDKENDSNAPVSPSNSFSDNEDSDGVYDSFVQKREVVEKLLLKGVPPSPDDDWPLPPADCF